MQEVNSQLKAGDCLSYSAGTKSFDPFNFRVVKNLAGNTSQPLKKPEGLLGEVLCNTPFLVNTYPATLSNFDWAIFIETFLNRYTFSRSLVLAAKLEKSLVITGQPLLIAEFFLRHIEEELEIPNKIIISAGGYYFPESLEKFVYSLLKKRNVQFQILNYYGVASVDAGLLVSSERDSDQYFLFQPRDENVSCSIQAGNLLISLKDSTGKLILDSFNSGDKACIKDGKIKIIDSNRLSTKIKNMLESFNSDSWSRYSGYMASNPDGAIELQLRKNIKAKKSDEIEYYDFKRKYDMSWLRKPVWSH